MQELLETMLEKAKTDKRALSHLKNASVRLQQYELAAKLREIETTNFPESEEQKHAKKIAKEVQGILAMCELREVKEDVCWLIWEAMEQYRKKRVKFSLREAASIVVKRKELFDID